MADPTEPLDPQIAAIDAELRNRQWPRARLGRALGLDSKQLNRLFNGERRLQPHELARANEFLWPGRGDLPRAGGVIGLPGLVPLYGWVGAASDSRLTLAEQNLRAYVPMHPAQQNVIGAFALEVADVSMSPRYEPGEIVYLHPNRWPARGQDCVLVTLEHEGFLKRFLRREADELVLHQLNPEKDLEFALDRVEAVHAVVGRG